MLKAYQRVIKGRTQYIDRNKGGMMYNANFHVHIISCTSMMNTTVIKPCNQKSLREIFSDLAVQDIKKVYLMTHSSKTLS